MENIKYTHSIMTLKMKRLCTLPGKRTSVQIYEGTREELIKIRGYLESKNGKPRSLEDVILELIEYWKKGHKMSSSV